MLRLATVSYTSSRATYGPKDPDIVKETEIGLMDRTVEEFEKKW